MVGAMDAETLKVEMEAESCCVCGAAGEGLRSPEEHDAAAAAAAPPLRAMLLHLNNGKTVPSGRLCATCIHKTEEAYSFSTTLAATGPPPLSEKIRALRKRLHELTQKIDVFIVVGGGSSGAYSEEDIIMVEREALEAARRAERAEAERRCGLRGEHEYQCTVCPLTFQHSAQYRAHAASHGAGAVHSCWTCGAQFAGAAAAAEHAEGHARGAGAALVCYLCDTTFQSPGAMRRHSCPPRCPACGLQARSLAALRAHAGAHAGLCGACFRAFPSAEEAQAHAVHHRRHKLFVCGYDSCILRFTTRSNLLAHIRKCHAGEMEPAGEPPASGASAGAVTCSLCPRTFASVAAMKRHARVHRGERAPAPAPAPGGEGEGAGAAEEDAEGKVEYLEMETLDEGDEYIM